LIAALMMATCLLLSAEARMAKTDAMLLLTTVAAMGALARAYLPEQRERIAAAANWTVPAIFWTALAAGVLVKGPVIVMFVALAVGALVVIDRSAGWLAALRPLPGIAWFALLVLPWFLAIVARSGESFVADSVGQDLLAKIMRGQESHGAPPGYFILFWLTFWPGGGPCRRRCARDLGGAARARREVPAGLDTALVAGAGDRGDQAAALCARALPRDRDPHRRYRRCACSRDGCGSRAQPYYGS
jgi:4-amino-4-deoxy-L-arabinose transferase-like glycosyltransferase